MNPAIALDNELCFSTIEVSDVSPELMLTPELRIVQLAIPQQLPKHIFCRCLRLPHFSHSLFKPRKIKTTSIMGRLAVSLPLYLWERGQG